MVYTGTHVPLLNQLLPEYRAAVKGNDAYAKAVMKGREAVGYAIIGSAALAVHNGMVTGNGPSDPARRKEWLRPTSPALSSWVMFGWTTAVLSLSDRL